MRSRVSSRLIFSSCVWNFGRAYYSYGVYVMSSKTTVDCCREQILDLCVELRGVHTWNNMHITRLCRPPVVVDSKYVRMGTCVMLVTIPICLLPRLSSGYTQILLVLSPEVRIPPSCDLKHIWKIGGSTPARAGIRKSTPVAAGRKSWNLPQKKCKARTMVGRGENSVLCDPES